MSESECVGESGVQWPIRNARRDTRDQRNVMSRMRSYQSYTAADRCARVSVFVSSFEWSVFLFACVFLLGMLSSLFVVVVVCSFDCSTTNQQQRAKKRKRKEKKGEKARKETKREHREHTIQDTQTNKGTHTHTHLSRSPCVCLMFRCLPRFPIRSR